MKHSIFLIYGNVCGYSLHLTTKNTDFSKTNIIYWSFDREEATVFFSRQAAEEHIELYAQKMLEYMTKLIHNSELLGQETKNKKYIEAYDAYWEQLKLLVPVEVEL